MSESGDTLHLMHLNEGRPWPMGAHVDGDGLNFAVHSSHAQAIELCIFDANGQVEQARLRLPGHSGDVFHGRLPNAGPGLVYGLRAAGPWRPERGHRFNPNKLLLDPYAREIVGRFEWRDEHFGADLAHPSHRDMSDNAAHALKARVVRDDDFDWTGDAHPCTPLADSVLYEVHVKGFSRLQPALPEALRGTYAGLAHEHSIAHFKRLGITALSLLPVHYRLDEERLAKMGLSNHWGYNTLGFFAPDPRLAAQPERVRDEFRAMVRTLHAAGIEVILDVVYNHTAECDEKGPTLSFRGLDNAGYYRLDATHKQLYENHAGCGNMLDIRQPRVLQLVLDSLRYWVAQMHVDGFRFDLATVLGRGDHGFDARGAFFTAIAQDPLLSRVKMIAEPWDIGPGGYQVGGFPRGWLEWNDQFRDTMRGFWLREGDAGGTRGDWARRLCASSDVYEARHRAPAESVNYVVSHDGFTLRDLVSYEHKHNEANGEENRDGHGHNLSVNGGVEGPTDDAAVNAWRARLQRVLIATALLAQGTPMLCAGDELGHTQQGNNNPYCQDNEISWIDWSKADDDLIAFSARVLSLRRQALPFANHWYSGLTDKHGLHDLAWLRPDGEVLHGPDWNDAGARALGCLIGKPGRAQAPLLLLANASDHEVPFMLPAGVWRACLDSSHARGLTRWHGQGGVVFKLPSRALVVFAAAGNQLDLS